MAEIEYSLRPIGFIRSSLTSRTGAPRQGGEGAPDAWVELDLRVSEGLMGMTAGNEVILITWLHQAAREVLQVHPRGEAERPIAGVFTTRSPDRPNPLGLHRVTVLGIAGISLKVGPIEAIDGTPVVDIKPARGRCVDW
jgi:tRNA-Thr(GGU) m(6)t(6)A37 methyltransferase TsaA